MITVSAGFVKGKYMCILAWTVYASVHVVISLTHLGGLKKVQKLIRSTDQSKGKKLVKAVNELSFSCLIYLFVIAVLYCVMLKINMHNILSCR